MNKFEKQLEKWNGGILRGAQAKLAKILQVSTATVALWATGKRRPSKGFINKMAQLFALDEYAVVRLFPAATLYPELSKNRPAASLRDAQAAENAYSADFLADGGNSVSIPLLTRIGPNFPQYEEENVAECWTLPRRAALGAKCLVAYPSGKAPEEADLYLIRPGNTWEEQGILLIYLNGEARLARVQTLNGQTSVNLLDGTPVPGTKETISVLGAAVRKITGRL